MRHLITSLLHAIAPQSGQASPTSPTAAVPSKPTKPGKPTRPHPTDPYEVKAALRALQRVPRDELPDGPARDALAEAIRAGAVDHIYAPVGADYHNLTLAWVEPHVDPRRTIIQWITAWGQSQASGGQGQGLTPALDFLLAMRGAGGAGGGR